MEREIEIYALRRRSQIAFKWSLQRAKKWFQTHFSSDPVAEKWLQTHFVLWFDGVMKCEREVRKREKFWLKIFEGTKKEKWSEALEFATIISNRSELTWQYRSYGLHKGQKFYNPATELCISETEKTNLVFSVFITLSQKFWVWVMKTRLGNQTKQKKLCWSHVF